MCGMANPSNPDSETVIRCLVCQSVNPRTARKCSVCNMTLQSSGAAAAAAGAFAPGVSNGAGGGVAAGDVRASLNMLASLGAAGNPAASLMSAPSTPPRNSVLAGGLNVGRGMAATPMGYSAQQAAAMRASSASRMMFATPGWQGGAGLQPGSGPFAGYPAPVMGSGPGRWGGRTPSGFGPGGIPRGPGGMPAGPMPGGRNSFAVGMGTPMPIPSGPMGTGPGTGPRPMSMKK